MVVSLIGPMENAHVQRVLLVAAYAGIVLKVVPITDGKENTTEAYRLNVSPLMRIPAMKTDEGYLFEAHAMIRYLARTEVMLMGASAAGMDGGSSEKIPHPQYPVQYAMYGHSLLESAEVDSWLDLITEKIDTLVLLFSNQDSVNGGGKSGFLIGDYRRPTDKDRRQLFANMAALENRIMFLKETRTMLVKQSGGALTARSYLEDELYIYGDVDESGNATTGATGKKDNRISSVYNVAGSIRSKMEEQDRAGNERQVQEIRNKTDAMLEGRESSANETGLSIDVTRVRSTRGYGNLTPRDSSVISPRMSVLVSPRATLGVNGGSRTGRAGDHAGPAGNVIQRQDLLFLVGDSLTAADLSLAMALHSLYQIPSLRTEAISSYNAVYRYYKSIMMLPVAVEMRKALKINMA